MRRGRQPLPAPGGSNVFKILEEGFADRRPSAPERYAEGSV